MKNVSGKYITAWNRIYTNQGRQKCPQTPLLRAASQKSFYGADLPPSLHLHCSCICISAGDKQKQPQALSSCYYKDKLGHGTAMEVFICVICLTFLKGEPVRSMFFPNRASPYIFMADSLLCLLRWPEEPRKLTAKKNYFRTALVFWQVCLGFFHC